LVYYFTFCTAGWYKKICLGFLGRPFIKASHPLRSATTTSSIKQSPKPETTREIHQVFHTTMFNNIIKALTLAALLDSALACNFLAKRASDACNYDWGYEAGNGPKVWSKLNSTYAKCAVGRIGFQTPVNLMLGIPRSPDLVMEYINPNAIPIQPMLYKLMHEGETIKFRPYSGVDLTPSAYLDGKEWTFSQVWILNEESGIGNILIYDWDIGSFSHSFRAYAFWKAVSDGGSFCTRGSQGLVHGYPFSRLNEAALTL
jgi:hypothetical protein